MSQMKEDQIIARELNEMEVSNMSDGEFKVMVRKILRGAKSGDTLNKEKENVKLTRDEEFNN